MVDLEKADIIAAIKAAKPELAGVELSRMTKKELTEMAQAFQVDLSTGTAPAPSGTPTTPPDSGGTSSGGEDMSDKDIEELRKANEATNKRLDNLIDALQRQASQPAPTPAPTLDLTQFRGMSPDLARQELKANGVDITETAYEDTDEVNEGRILKAEKAGSGIKLIVSKGPMQAEEAKTMAEEAEEIADEATDKAEEAKKKAKKAKGDVWKKKVKSFLLDTDL